MELLEYVDENNEKIIGTAERDYIHENNLWHREISVWVMNEKKELLLQRRSAKKKQGANKLSIVAGHIGVNEKEISAAVRELEEEIGLKVNESALKFIDVYKSEYENNNCFSYNYLIKTDKRLEDVTMQEDEVSELKYISIEELEDRLEKQDEEIGFRKKPHIKLVLQEIKKLR